ncbi:MAG: hypothetical protein M0P69_09780 [Bacteroidales bacterium]|nr:hypothetical protein [Bacteroidales bacterium]
MANRMERALKLSNEKYNRDSAARRAKLSAEPKVAVYGNPLYKEFLGDTYSFDYHDYPVIINFDGKNYLYPKTIAEELQKKLDAAARGNTPKNISESVVV